MFTHKSVYQRILFWILIVDLSSNGYVFLNQFLIYLFKNLYVFYIVIDTKLHLKKVNCDYFLFLYPIFPFSFSKLGMKNIKSRAGETVFRRQNQHCAYLLGMANCCKTLAPAFCTKIKFLNNSVPTLEQQNIFINTVMRSIRYVNQFQKVDLKCLKKLHLYLGYYVPLCSFRILICDSISLRLEKSCPNSIQKYARKFSTHMSDRRRVCSLRYTSFIKLSFAWYFDISFLRFFWRIREINSQKVVLAGYCDLLWKQSQLSL